MEYQADLGLEEGEPGFVTLQTCLDTEDTLPGSRVLVTVGGTTTDENGAYELTLRSDIDTYTISAQGGKNIITGEDNDSTFTVSSKVGYHINPASELASDLIEEGMSVEEAKDKVIEFVNSDLSNVDSLSKEDLFDRSMTKDMETQNRKGAMKAVVFNTLNNIKEMLVEAVESDAPSAEEVEKEVRKAIAKELRLINHKEGQNVNISNLVESAIDRVGEEIELLELKEVSKKSIIGSTINSQSHELTSIDLGDSNVFKTIATVETKRHEIKEEKSMMEELVKIDVSVESDDDSKLSVLKAIKSKKKEEIEEERKTREPINFESKLDKIKERLELQEQIFDLIEEAGSQIAYVRGITKYDEKEFLSILKGADSINAEFDELKSEIKERNDIEDLGFDEGKFEKVQSAIDELYAILKKQHQLLNTPVEEPVEKPVKEEPVKVTYKTGDGMIKFKKWMDYIFEKYVLPQEFSLPTNESEFDARFNDMKSATEQLFEEAKLVEAEPWEMRIADNYLSSWLITNRFGGEEPNENLEYRLRELYKDMFYRVFETIELFKPLGNKESFANLQVRSNKINYYINEYSKFDTELANAKTEFLSNNEQVWRMNNALSYFIRKIYGEYYKTLVDSEISKRSNNSNGKKLLVNVDDFNNIKITSEGIEFDSTPVSVDNIKEVANLGGNYYYELEEGAYEEIGTNKFKVSILKGKYYANQREAFLPGLIYRAQDASWQSYAVLFVGLEECGSYTMTPITLSISTHGFHNQHTVLHNEVDLTISNFRDVEFNGWNNYFSEIWRDGDSSLDTFEDLKNSSYWQIRFEEQFQKQYAKVNDYFNTLSLLNVGNTTVQPCDGYVKLESNNSNFGYYKTINMVGPYDAEYKDCLYGKFNMELQTNEVFELVEGEYVKYSGKVYASTWNVPLTLADKIRENRQAEYYESVDGILLRYNAHMNYGLGNSGRGFKTCEGLEKNDTYEVHGSYFANNQNLLPYWEDKTVILKEKDGTIISEQTVDNKLITESSTEFLNSGRFNNQTYLVSVNSNGSTVTITFESDSIYSNSSNYYPTDSKGKIDYEASTQCVDADGDEIPATVDLDDNDPSIGGDTDRDGIADHEDVFPFDAGTAYTLVRDIETDEQKVVNANLVKFAGTANYMFYIEYPSEGKGEKEKEERSMPIIFGFEIISSTTEDYDVSLSRFNLETGKRFNLDFSDQQSEILERVQEVRNKYSGEGGKK